MTILSVVQNVCLVVGYDVPSQVFASTDRENLEMARLANEMAERIAEVYDWQKLRLIKVMTGTGDAEAFDLPTDYSRMLKKASLWSSRWSWAFEHIADADTWLEYQVEPNSFISGNWIIYGDQFHVLPIMGDAETLKFFYISNQIVQANPGGTKKTAFTADTDTFRLNEKLLELGMIWQWRANKGMPYAEDMKNYEVKLNQLMDKDRGSKSVIRSQDRQRWDKNTFPGIVGGANGSSINVPDGYSILIGDDD